MCRLKLLPATRKKASKSKIKSQFFRISDFLRQCHLRKIFFVYCTFERKVFFDIQSDHFNYIFSFKKSGVNFRLFGQTFAVDNHLFWTSANRKTKFQFWLVHIFHLIEQNNSSISTIKCLLSPVTRFISQQMFKVCVKPKKKLLVNISCYLWSPKKALYLIFSFGEYAVIASIL